MCYRSTGLTRTDTVAGANFYFSVVVSVSVEATEATMPSATSIDKEYV